MFRTTPLPKYLRLVNEEAELLPNLLVSGRVELDLRSCLGPNLDQWMKECRLLGKSRLLDGGILTHRCPQHLASRLARGRMCQTVLRGWSMAWLGSYSLQVHSYVQMTGNNSASVHEHI